MALLTFHSWVRPQHFHPIFTGKEVGTTPHISIRCLGCCLDWLIAHQRHNVTPGNWLDCLLSSSFREGQQHHYPVFTSEVGTIPFRGLDWLICWPETKGDHLDCDSVHFLGCWTFTQNFHRRAWEVHGTPFIFLEVLSWLTDYHPGSERQIILHMQHFR